jgi:hypothetical protein
MQQLKYATYTGSQFPQLAGILLFIANIFEGMAYYLIPSQQPSTRWQGTPLIKESDLAPAELPNIPPSADFIEFGDAPQKPISLCVGDWVRHYEERQPLQVIMISDTHIHLGRLRVSLDLVYLLERVPQVDHVCTVNPYHYSECIQARFKRVRGTGKHPSKAAQKLIDGLDGFDFGQRFKVTQVDDGIATVMDIYRKFHKFPVTCLDVLTT